MKQILWILLFTIVAYADKPVHFTPDEMDYLRKKREVTLCISPKGLPLFGHKEGKNIGIIPEIVHTITQKLPIPTHYVDVASWVECIELTREKKVDIAAVIITAPNKHIHLIPSDKVIDAPIGIATKTSRPLFSSLGDIEGKVAVLKGQKSVNSYVDRNYPNISIVKVDSDEEGLRMVADGRVYGFVDDVHTLAYYIARRHSNELKIMERLNKRPLTASLGIRKDEPELLHIMNKIIRSIDGQTFRDIIHKWVSVRVEKGFDYSMLLKVIALFIVILLIIVYWTRKLSKEVERRKAAEAKLRQFNLDLEREISGKVEEIRRKDALLVESSKLAAMGEMIGAIAHQWRRPLSILHINIELLEEDYKEDRVDEAFLRDFIAKNSAIVQFMSKTIDDFQNFYRIDKQMRLFDVQKNIEIVLNIQSGRLKQNGIVLQIEGESFKVWGYPN